MEALARDFADFASFYTVWVREAHPGGRFPQTASAEDRRAYAEAFCRSDQPSIPVLLDDMDGTLHRLFAYMPNAVVVLDPEGRVAYRATWRDVREVRRVLERLQEGARRRASKVNAGMPRWSEEFLPSLPEEPGTELATAFRVWEEAENYDEPERFFGPERAARMRALYEQVSGKKSRHPAGVEGGGG